MYKNYLLSIETFWIQIKQARHVEHYTMRVT